MVSDQVFRVVPQPGAELQIRRAGGLAALLMRSGVDLRMALSAEDVCAVVAASPGVRVALPGAPTHPPASSSVADCNQHPGGEAAASRSSDQQPPQQPATGATGVAASALADAPATAATGSGAASALADAPAFAWREDEQFYFRLADCEAVQAALRRADRGRSLLTLGGPIPAPTLRAYRWGCCPRAARCHVMQPRPATRCMLCSRGVHMTASPCLLVCCHPADP